MGSKSVIFIEFIFEQLVTELILKETSTGWVKLGGQILNVVTLLMVVSDQLFAIDVAFSDNEGVIGGVVVALTIMVFEFEIPPGLDNVSVIEYVPFGKVIGNGVRRLELDELKGVPELVTNVQFTVVDEEILLPVEIKVNKTEDPAHTFKFVPECSGFVEKLAFNCPLTFPDKKNKRNRKEYLSRVRLFFK